VLCPASQPDRSGSLDKLANGRFEQRGDLNDLEEAIGFYRQALELFPVSHPDRLGSLAGKLANALFDRWVRKGDYNDLEEAIGLYQRTLDLFPVSHPHRSGCFGGLADALFRRFGHRGDLNDLEEALDSTDRRWGWNSIIKPGT